MRTAKRINNKYSQNQTLIQGYRGFISDLAEREWVTKAACRGLGTDMFFPMKGETQLSIAAKQLCRSCPVQEECYDYGKDEQYGIWGGKGLHERRRDRQGR